MKNDVLTPDTQVVLLLCSSLGLSRTSSAPKPLSRSEWNDLARAISASSLRRPGALFGLPVESMRTTLNIASPLADRLAALMSRGAQLAIELERLQALGIWVVTRSDDHYPARLRERLKGQAPPVLFGAGPIPLVDSRGVAIVGSRNVDDAGAAFAAALGHRCAEADLTVFSGGAKGVDKIGVDAAIEAGGSAVVVLADSLEDAIRRRDTRERLLAGTLTLVTPLHPSVKFSVAAAMGRNKLIYGLATWAVVVASDSERGGTWAGAVENLRANWVPLFVRAGDAAPAGNRELLKRGGRPLVLQDLSHDVASWLESHPSEPAASLVHEAPSTYAATPVSVEDSGGSDLFPEVWPRLAAYLVEPRTPKEVAGRFGLEGAQAKAWLARALNEGLVQRLSKPVRFQRVAVEPGGQTTLFEP